MIDHIFVLVEPGGSDAAMMKAMGLRWHCTKPPPVHGSSITLGSAADGQICARRCPRPAAQQAPVPWVMICFLQCHR